MLLMRASTLAGWLTTFCLATYDGHARSGEKEYYGQDGIAQASSADDKSPLSHRVRLGPMLHSNSGKSAVVTLRKQKTSGLTDVRGDIFSQGGKSQIRFKGISEFLNSSTSPHPEAAIVYDPTLQADAHPENASGVQEQAVRLPGHVVGFKVEQNTNKLSNNDRRKKFSTSVTNSVLSVSFPKTPATITKQLKTGALKSQKNSDETEMYNVDEYLKKSLADIVADVSDDFNAIDSKESYTDGAVVKSTAQKQHESIAERNREIVEEAMNAHANNPNLTLPLVKKQGNQMKLNKEDYKQGEFKQKPATQKASSARPFEVKHGKGFNDFQNPKAIGLVDKASNSKMMKPVQDQISSNLMSSAPAIHSPKPALLELPTSVSTQEVVFADPYASIQEGLEKSEHIGGSRQSTDGTALEADEAEEDEDVADEENYDDHHKHHHHHRHYQLYGHHNLHDDDDEDLDEDEEEEPDEDEVDDDDDSDYTKSHILYEENTGL